MSTAIPQKPLQALLRQAGQAGIYHLPHGAQTALSKAAKALGFTSFKVNFEDSDNMGTILGALGRDLDFPNWYGANFDGLNDCLTDFSWHEAPGYMITIYHADAVHAVPNSFNALNEVLANAIETWQTHKVPLWVFYDLRSNGLATLPTLT